MNRNKSTYERPKCDLLVVRFEQGVLTGSPNYGAKGAAGNAVEDGYEYDL